MLRGGEGAVEQSTTMSLQGEAETMLSIWKVILWKFVQNWINKKTCGKRKRNLISHRKKGVEN